MGAKFKTWLGACPRIFQLRGRRGGGIGPEIQNIGGGKYLKIQTYLVLKGENFFDPFKNPYSGRFTWGIRKIIFESPKIDIYCIFRQEFFENLPKFL